jgi:hypothetical protein
VTHEFTLSKLAIKFNLFEVPVNKIQIKVLPRRMRMSLLQFKRGKMLNIPTFRQMVNVVIIATETSYTKSCTLSQRKCLL